MKKQNNVTQRGITLVALIITIIVLLILAGVSIHAIFGNYGIITTAQFLNNEQEISVIQEAMRLYYLNNELASRNDNPVGEQFLQSKITDSKTLETIVQYQSDAENTDQIHYDRLYRLDIKKLGINNVNNEYFMDIETRIVYINNGVKVSSGMIYVLEEREIFPVVLAAEQIERGFKLTATVDERNEQISSYHFYINNELYRTISTSQNSVSIEVTDKAFGEYSCSVKVDRTIGQSDRSLEVIAENYSIRGIEDMVLFRDSVNSGKDFSGKTVKLVNNIDLKGNASNQWIPIGTTINFQGTFDGNYYEISNLYIDTNEYSNVGLFKIIGGNATVKNLIIKNSYIHNRYSVLGDVPKTGTIVGINEWGKILNCGIESGTVIVNQLNTTDNSNQTGGPITGAICGESYGTIEGCYNKASIEVNSTFATFWIFSGGIVGGNIGSIRNSYNLGNLMSKGMSSWAGGVVGYSNGGQIANCYNTGTLNVTGENLLLGGILGRSENQKNNPVTIENCYYTNNLEYAYTTPIDGIGGYQGIDLNNKINETELKNYIEILGQAYMMDTTIPSNYPILKWQVQKYNK